MITNPVKCIRDYCLECSGDIQAERLHCPITDCKLYPFRLGRNPYRTKRVLSEERRAVLAEQLRKAREVQ